MMPQVALTTDEASSETSHRSKKFIKLTHVFQFCFRFVGK